MSLGQNHTDADIRERERADHNILAIPSLHSFRPSSFHSVRPAFDRPLYPRYDHGMSVCIAAYALAGFGDPRIVMACDWLTSDEDSTTESTDKCIPHFAPGFCAMFAGVEEDVSDLMRFYRKRFSDYETPNTKLTYELLKVELWAGMCEFKDWLIRCGRKKRWRVQLLVCGFIDREPIILVVDQTRIISVKSIHWSIGTGAFGAEFILRYRTQGFQWPINLKEIIYSVYEAKKMGEMSPYVGKLTTLMVASPVSDGSLQIDSVNPDGLNFLESEFERFKPQPLIGLNTLPHDYFFKVPTVVGQFEKPLSGQSDGGVL